MASNFHRDIIRRAANSIHRVYEKDGAMVVEIREPKRKAKPKTSPQSVKVVKTTKKPDAVSIESPYNNKDPKILKRNINYAILSLKDATRNYGNAAYASHLLNTQYVENGEHRYIDDDTEDKYDCDRETVIEITNTFRRMMDKIVFYIDFGYSSGMLAAVRFAKEHKIPIEERTLPEEMLKEVMI